MRADGELTKEQYQALYKKATQEQDALKEQIDNQSDTQENESMYDLAQIRKGLSQMVDISTPHIPDELIEEFVEVVTPVENHHYRWKMNFGEVNTAQERSNLIEPKNPPVLSFQIDFENARQYRIANHMPMQFRKNDWTDLMVEVYI